MNELIFNHAFNLATEAFQADEVPVGAVIFDTQTCKIVSAARNMTESLCDPLAHAELLAIKQACQKLNLKRLNGYSLFVTLEPCTMCAGAIAWARLDNLYFGAFDPKTGGIEQGPKVFTHPQTHHKIKIQGGIHADECGALLKTFFKDKR